MTNETHNLHEERLLNLESHKVVYQFHKPICRLDGIGKNKIWMADPSKFNDPLDFSLNLKDLTDRGAFTIDRIKQAMSYLLNNQTSNNSYWFYDHELLEDISHWIESDKDVSFLQRVFNRKLKVCGVSCFTSSWRNQLMWSHYANSHKGFCVEYCVRPMDLATGNPDFLQYDVQYHSSSPELCLTELLFSPYQALIKVFATKQIEWAYEREWRLIHIKQTGNVELPTAMRVSALIAGNKIPSTGFDRLKRMGKKINVPVYQSDLTSSDFRLRHLNFE